MKTLLNSELSGDGVVFALRQFIETIDKDKRYWVQIFETESLDHRALNYPCLEPEYRHDIGGTEMPLMREDV